MQDKKYGNPLALLPLLIFVLIYLGGSWYLGDFYQLPVLSIFLLALLVAFVEFPKVPFTEKLKAFAKGGGEETLVVMLLIFLLAGACSDFSKQLCAVTAVVELALW